jgi:hypothetical protein
MQDFHRNTRPNACLDPARVRALLLEYESLDITSTAGTVRCLLDDAVELLKASGSRGAEAAEEDIQLAASGR